MNLSRTEYSDIKKEINDLEKFINNNIEYTISNKAKFTYFKHRSKVEFLKYFIV